MNRSLMFNGLLPGLLAISLPSFAETQKIIFEENKNQWPSQVMYQAQIKGGSLFLEKNTFTYLFKEQRTIADHGTNTSDSAKIRFHSFKVNFQNSNPDVVVSGNNLFQGHRNYYRGNDPQKWAANVKLYGQVNYKNLYPSIDMTVYNAEENLKYDFIVNPGGNVKNIKLNYTGPDEMHLEYGHLYIKTSVGLIIEQKPYAYQEINGMQKKITCGYVLKKNTISFDLGDYDPLLPLIIDPLIGSTYTGSFTDNRGYTATYDAAGNMYTGGTAWDQGYPYITGSWDSTYNGFDWDIVLSKFSPTATSLLFSTYYGGNNDEQPHSIIVNSNNELYVAGRTNSTDFPTLNTYGTSFQTANNGGFDIVIGKFNSAGYLLASTYLGGSGDDCVNVSVGSAYSNTKVSWGDDGRSEIILDANSNVYIAANTKSANFPTSASPFDNSLNGIQDAVIVRLNSNLTATNYYGTYLGGSGYDAAYGLKLDNNNKIYVTGGTTSNDFPIPVAGVIKTTFGGVADGFIAVLDPSLAGAAQLLRSTYLGTAAYDQSYLIEIDASNDLYVYGQTAGSYSVTAGAYSYPTPNPASGMFIHKVTGNLNSTVFSTVIGSVAGGINLSPTAFLVDSCQTIYFAGWGRCIGTGTPQWNCPYQSSTTGLPIAGTNIYQSTTDGCDFYFAVLTPDAKSLYYATFFGANVPNPDHVDGGTSRFDKRGVIYTSVCASCLGTQAFPTYTSSPPPATPYSTSNNATDNSRCNNAVVKMDFSLNPKAVASATVNPGCNTLTVPFSSTGSVATHFYWNFGDGYTSTLPNPIHTFTAGIGNPPQYTFTVTLQATDSIGICGIHDYAAVVINVGQSAALTTAQTNILCTGQPGAIGSATVTANGGMPPLTYLWSPPSNATTPIVTNLVSGNHTVTVTDAFGCDSTVVITITEVAPLVLNTSSSGATCGMANGTASVTVSGGTAPYSYAWSDTSGSNVGVNLTTNGLSAGTYTITVTDVNGCTKTQVVSMGVANGPTVTAITTSPIPCNGGTTSATSFLVNGTPPYTYSWNTTPLQNTQIATGLSAGITYVITIYDAMGCSAQYPINIPEPPVLVPVISPTNVSCFGGNNGSATVNVTGGAGGYTYAWSTLPIQQTTQTATGLTATPGIYSVLVTDANGCTKTVSTTITQPGTSGIIVNTMPSGIACGTHANGVIISNVLNGTPPYSYNWSNTQTSPNISNLSGGTYTVIVTDANNCTSSGIATIPTLPQPVANFNFTPTISCEGVVMQFTDSSSNALTWSWNFGGLGSSTTQHPGFVFPYSGTYMVTLTVTNPPCDSTISKPVVIGDLGNGTIFKEANVFSPNNDQINDCFFPALINASTGLPDATLMQCTYLEVFDRWGIKMYESLGSNGTNCWNGNNKNDNKPAQDGTYYYIAKLGNTTIKGYVTLARHK